MDRAEKRSRKNTAMADIEAVQEVLRRWDPIGIISNLIENELAPDEYDSYAPHIVSMLAGGCSRDELLRHLDYCRTGAMGLPADESADRKIADELMKWWERRVHDSENSPSA